MGNRYPSTDAKIEETYRHVKDYMKEPECTKALREMCENCELYCGDRHDFEECIGKPCFDFWLCHEYLEWNASYGG